MPSSSWSKRYFPRYTKLLKPDFEPAVARAFVVERPQLAKPQAPAAKQAAIAEEVQQRTVLKRTWPRGTALMFTKGWKTASSI